MNSLGDWKAIDAKVVIEAQPGNESLSNMVTMTVKPGQIVIICSDARPLGGDEQ